MSAHAIEASLQLSRASNAEPGREFGIDLKTLATWRKRQTAEDPETGPREPSWTASGPAPPGTHAADRISGRRPKLAALMEESAKDVTADILLTFPVQYRGKLHSMRLIERLKTAIYPLADIVGLFLKESSIVRPTGAVAFEQNDGWSLRHRYIQVEAFSKIGAARFDPILSITAEAAWSCPKAFSPFPPSERT